MYKTKKIEQNGLIYSAIDAILMTWNMQNELLLLSYLN